jgi:hypothetical protein
MAYPSEQVTNQSDMVRLFICLGVPKRTAFSLVYTIERWIKTNGPEWTVERLKEFHTLAIKWVGGDPLYRIPSGHAVKNRIACRGDGTPRGPFGYFFKGLRKIPLTSRKLDDIISALKVYTGIKLGRETHSQVNKFLTNVEEPDRMLKEHSFKENCADYQVLHCLWQRAHYDSLDRWTNTRGKKCLTFNPETERFGSASEVSIPRDRHRWEAALLSPDIILRFFSCYERSLGKDSLPKGFESILRSSVSHHLVARPSLKVTLRDFYRRPIIGKIGFIQERGAKARIVANPVRIHQVAMSKLQNFLELVVKMGLPWDCTFDQGKGVRWIQRKLREGERLVCTDLSSFTDLYPLSMVIDTLKWLGPNNTEFTETLSLVEALSQGYWYFRSRKAPLKHTVKWTKGTPMGLNGMFLANGVTHGFQLRNIEIDLGLQDSFRVVGDDVVMTTKLYNPYVRVSRDLGVRIHPYKGLNSDTVGDFVSRLATKDRVIRAFKFPDDARLFSYAKPLELLMKYGPKARRLIPKTARLEVTALSSLPKSMGGLGWKPPLSLKHADVYLIGAPPKEEQIPDVVHLEEKPVPPGVFKEGQVPHSSDGKSFIPKSNRKSITLRAEKYADTALRLQAAFGPLGNYCQGNGTHSPQDIYKEDEREVDPFDFLSAPATSVSDFGQGVQILVSKEPYYIGCSRCELPVESATDVSEDNLSSIDLQWEILHTNSNLYNFDKEVISLLREEAKKRTTGNRTNPFETINVDPLSSVRQRIRRAALDYLKAVENFRWFMFWKNVTSIIMDLNKFNK